MIVGNWDAGIRRQVEEGHISARRDPSLIGSCADAPYRRAVYVLSSPIRWNGSIYPCIVIDYSSILERLQSVHETMAFVGDMQGQVCDWGNEIGMWYGQAIDFDMLARDLGLKLS